MATAHRRLAASLEVLARLQRGSRRVFRGAEFTRVHRERLIRNGYLRRVINGWLLVQSPGVLPGDSTPWYAAFWEFCARYAAHRFGERWWLSSTMSALLHAGSTTIPDQVVLHAPAGSNNQVALPFGTSLIDLQDPREPAPEEAQQRDSLRILSPEAAAVRLPPVFFRTHPVEAQVLISQLANRGRILAHLLDRGQPYVAGRLAGAFRRLRRSDLADQIKDAMRAAGYDIRESDPFEPTLAVTMLPEAHPAAQRIRALWRRFRQPVLDRFPPAPGLPGDREAYVAAVSEIYGADAYHSLSIEGYQVSPELVQRVRDGAWDPEGADRRHRDALAALGHWRAFTHVRDAVGKVLRGAEAARVARVGHQTWHQALFAPSVRAGILPAHALAGYRSGPVFIRGSRHVPPRAEAVRPAMDALFRLLEEESEPAVRAVLGHWALGPIHPWPDGNGRMARFLMNLMLAAGGFVWTVIRVEDRAGYLAALEKASAGQDIRPFADFIAERVEVAQTPAPSRE